MFGAVIGDIVGSIYERHNIKSTFFDLFSQRSRFTDDSVMTIAVANWLMCRNHSHASLIAILQEYGRKYPNAGYGFKFKHWLYSNNTIPYNSWGNGSAMRVSPVGMYCSNINDVLALSKISAEVTHNHPEGIKGAQAIASAVFLAKEGKSKIEIKDFIETRFGYNLNRTCAEIRKEYKFDVSCQGSVPEAIICFLEGTDFETTLRLAVSLGGDSDTIAAMACSIASQTYSIPRSITAECIKRLPQDLKKVMEAFECAFKVNPK